MSIMLALALAASPAADPSIPAKCHDTATFAELTVTANGWTAADLTGLPIAAGDRITVQWTTAPGCEAQTIGIAAYATAFDRFEPDEFQPLEQHAVTALGSGGSLTFTVPTCRVQLDLHTGQTLPHIDATSRYNRPAFSLPGTDDLIGLGAYVDGLPCDEKVEPPSTTTSTVPGVTTTVAPPSPTTPPTSTTATPFTPSTFEEPVPVVRETPIPTTTEVQADVFTPLTVEATLPHTGTDSGMLAAVGVLLSAVGAAVCRLARSGVRWS